MTLFHSRLGVRHSAGWAFALGLLAVASIRAGAAPLNQNACAKLTQDMRNMKMLEVDKLMEKGPAWAVSHLSPGDLSLVRQYIDLDEQLRFRCSAPSSLAHLKHFEEDNDESGVKPAAETLENQAEKGQDTVKQSAKARHHRSQNKKAATAPTKPNKRVGQHPRRAIRYGHY